MAFVVIIVLLLAIASPNFVSVPRPGRARPPINNAAKIDALVVQFALENSKKAGSFINYPNDLTPCLRLGLAGSTPGFATSGIYIEIAADNLSAYSSGDLAASPHLLP